MPLLRNNFENQLHQFGKTVPLLTGFSGSGQVFINDATGVPVESVYHWNREWLKRYHSATNTSNVTGRPFTGGY
jgi:hypothetical protein